MSAPSDRRRQTQAVQLAVLLDALDGVALADAQRHTVGWLAGWETDTVENIAAIIRRAREHCPGMGRAGADLGAAAGALPWKLRVNDAVQAVFPTAVAEEIIADDAVGAW